MFELMVSPMSFILFLTLYFVGAIGSLWVKNNNTLANIWSSAFSIAGSLWGLGLSLVIILTGQTLSFVAQQTSFSLLSLSFDVDLLSAFFVFLISLIGLFCSIYGIGYVKHYYGQYSIGVLGFYYHLFILGLLLVVTAGSGIFFLIGWEIMSVASYFLIVYDRKERENVQAGFLYLVMTYAGTACILVAFLLLYQFTGSFDFDVIRDSLALIPASTKNIIFILALVGFGVKAGIVPLHIWLPAAHPAAPSHISAFLSGVMIKAGIFMMIRLFMDLLQPVPVWWGLTILLIGAASSLLGVLYALTEHDLKRLLAYHSIENIGIILLGLGSALIFASLDLLPLSLLSLTAALFHTLNHAIFKSLLFLCAGSVIQQVHTRNMEEYGGLIKMMPQTALFFLIGSAAISALPPFNGFFSEWLTFQSLFQGIVLLDSSVRWVFILAAGALAFTGGLALACFVKAFGVTFLARPRSAEAACAKESSWSLLVGMGSLAALSFLLGIFSGHAVFVLQNIGRSFRLFQGVPTTIAVFGNQTISIGKEFASVSGLAFLGVLAFVCIGVLFAVRWTIYRQQKVQLGSTWDCGVDLNARMEITATGFARSIVLIFKGLLKPSVQQKIEYDDGAIRYAPKLKAVILGTQDVYQTYLYQPMCRVTNALSARVKNIQSGNVNIYISYILVALIITLLFIL